MLHTSLDVAIDQDQLLDALYAATAPADAGEEPRGLLRVTAPLSIGTTILPPIVASYLERYPDVHVDLLLTRRGSIS